RHTRSKRDWSSDVCSSDLYRPPSLPSERPSAGLRLPVQAVPFLEVPDPSRVGPSREAPFPSGAVPSASAVDDSRSSLLSCSGGRSEERRVGKGGRGRRCQD